MENIQLVAQIVVLVILVFAIFFGIFKSHGFAYLGSLFSIAMAISLIFQITLKSQEINWLVITKFIVYGCSLLAAIICGILDAKRIKNNENVNDRRRY